MWWLALALAMVLGLFVSVIVLAEIQRRQHRHGVSPVVRCGSNLRRIGQATLLYAHDNKWLLPRGFGDLLATQPISSEAFVCPWSAERRAEGRNAEQTAADFDQTGRCSFVYVQRWPRIGGNPEAIVAFEDPANHQFTWVNVLYEDGSVYRLDMPTFMAHLTDLASGINPPKSRPMATHAAAVTAYEQTWRRRMVILKWQGLKAVASGKVKVESEAKGSGKERPANDQSPMTNDE